MATGHSTRTASASSAARCASASSPSSSTHCSHPRSATRCSPMPNRAALVDDAALKRTGRRTTDPPPTSRPAPLGRPMLYTSGTTGVPKGVWTGVLTEAEARRAAATKKPTCGASTRPTVTSCAATRTTPRPLRFSLGTLLAGGDVILPGKFDAATQLAAITQFEPTCSFMAPVHLHRLLDLTDDDPSPFTSFRLLAHAGAPLSDAVKHRAITDAPREQRVGVLRRDRRPVHCVRAATTGSRTPAPWAAPGPAARCGRRGRHDLVRASGLRPLRILERPGQDRRGVARRRVHCRRPRPPRRRRVSLSRRAPRRPHPHRRRQRVPRRDREGAARATRRHRCRRVPPRGRAVGPARVCRVRR